MAAKTYDDFPNRLDELEQENAHQCLDCLCSHAPDGLCPECRAERNAERAYKAGRTRRANRAQQAAQAAKAARDARYDALDRLIGTKAVKHL